jgi:hypothetical protein
VARASSIRLDQITRSIDRRCAASTERLRLLEDVSKGGDDERVFVPEVMKLCTARQACDGRNVCSTEARVAAGANEVG